MLICDYFSHNNKLNAKRKVVVFLFKKKPNLDESLGLIINGVALTFYQTGSPSTGGLQGTPASHLFKHKKASPFG